MIRVSSSWAGPPQPPISLALRELEEELPRLFESDVPLDIVLEVKNFQEGWKLQNDRIGWVSNGKGAVRIQGNHPRAVLFATYAFLEACGLRWLYPGEGGKRYVARSHKPFAAGSHRSQAAFLHRGIATEGAFGGPELVEFVEWMARHRLNHVFLQFESSRLFFQRANPDVSETPFANGIGSRHARFSRED